MGILKYRLHDSDRIISRTLAYAIVTGLLAGVYAGLMLLTTQVLRVHTPAAVTAATLAALFNPLRLRVQRAVDRRFNRARYDADQTMAAFAPRRRSPPGKVRSIDEVYVWDQARSQGPLVDVDHATLGNITLPGPPLFCALWHRAHSCRAPRYLDQHGPAVRSWSPTS